MLYELILINEIEQRAKIIFLSVASAHAVAGNTAIDRNLTLAFLPAGDTNGHCHYRFLLYYLEGCYNVFPLSLSKQPQLDDPESSNKSNRNTTAIWNAVW